MQYNLNHKFIFTVSSLQMEQTWVQNIASVNKPNKIPSKIKNMMQTIAAGTRKYVQSTERRKWWVKVAEKKCVTQDSKLKAQKSLLACVEDFFRMNSVYSWFDHTKGTITWRQSMRSFFKNVCLFHDEPFVKWDYLALFAINIPLLIWGKFTCNQ